MEAEEREALVKQSNDLRRELKVWEREFAAANDGRKAARDDIKQHPSIAQKYKEYNRTRDILSGKAVLHAPSPKYQKRKHDTAQVRRPSKRLQIFKTPLKSTSHPAVVDPYDSPSLVRNLFTPSQNRILGPTPQKDGHVLGLFDLLSEEGESPLKGHVTITGLTCEVKGTPHKPIRRDGEDVPVTVRHCRTPASSGKRFMLDRFATPLKGRHVNEQAGKTPSSISKLHSATPSFLRRDKHRTLMCPIQETTDGPILSPEMVRLPRKPLIRGLSSMLAGLRKMEEEAADDDLDVLHEMENEASSSSKPVNKSVVLVGDSQTPVLLGGFDDEAKYDSPPEELLNPRLGRDGQPLKSWKKRGQKRTTRRVNIKPVRAAKLPPQLTRQGDPPDSSSDELAAQQPKEETSVPETQQRPSGAEDYPAPADDASGNFDSDSASEYTASEGGTRYRRPNQGLKRVKVVGGGKGERKTRKVGPTAHVNFKRLKLRNSGSKGRVPHNSRFRRRK